MFSLTARVLPCAWFVFREREQRLIADATISSSTRYDRSFRKFKSFLLSSWLYGLLGKHANRIYVKSRAFLNGAVEWPWDKNVYRRTEGCIRWRASHRLIILSNPHSHFHFSCSIFSFHFPLSFPGCLSFASALHLFVQEIIHYSTIAAEYIYFP